MRNRSTTIYAQNENEYIKELDGQRTKTFSESYKTSKISNLIENIDLGCLNIPTLEEQEKLEETDLLKSLEKINKGIKTLKITNNSPDNKERLDKYIKEEIHSLSSGLGILNDEEDRDSNVSNFTNSGRKTNYTDFTNNIIKQNLEIVEGTIKLLVIGDKKVGKSLFINTIINDDCENKENRLSKNINPEYQPTASIEIKKVITEFKDKRIKLEFFDTNISILNSNMINTYFSICSGIVLICDSLNMDSILLIEKQIEQILKLNHHKKIFLIANLQFNNQVLSDSDLKSVQKNFATCDNYLREEIVNRFDIEINYIDVMYITKENKKLSEYLFSLLKRKQSGVKKK